MSIGSGKHWRRWRNVGAIMGKRWNTESELRKRFGQDGIKESGVSRKAGKPAHNGPSPEVEPKADTGSITTEAR